MFKASLVLQGGNMVQQKINRILINPVDVRDSIMRTVPLLHSFTFFRILLHSSVLLLSDEFGFI